ncbi:MAG TPA: sulfurtransferase [Thermodesulfobacteriota bacterium]
MTRGNPDLLWTPETLAARMKADPRLLVLDTRFAEQYAMGHIPGATACDVWAISFHDTRPGFAEAFLYTLQHYLEIRGVTLDRPVCWYSDFTDLKAARGFWILDYFGHEDVHVLDGGYNAWVAAGMPVTRDAVPPTAAVLTPRPRRERLATVDDVRAALGRSDTVLVDTRSDDEFLGRLVRGPRAGTIPGSVHLEWLRSVDEAGRLLPEDRLAAQFERLGVTPDREVIAYCQGGYRGAHTYLALRRLGYPAVRNYLGAWLEWSRRADLPMEDPTRRRDPERPDLP